MYGAVVRTAVTLDADVEKLLREAMARGKKSFKKALNEAIRLGLAGRGEIQSRPTSSMRAPWA